jgi:hypothetical protein
MPDTFVLTSPSGVLFVGAVVLALVMTGLAAWFAVRGVRERQAARIRYTVGRGLLALTFVAGAAYVAQVAFGMQAARVRLTGEALRVEGVAPGVVVPLDSVQADAAGRVDLRRQGAFRLRRRLRGLDLPGYRVGWFQLINRQRVFAYVTDPTRVVYVPTERDYALLLSVAEPEVFIATLRARAPAGMPTPPTSRSSRRPRGGGAWPCAAEPASLACATRPRRPRPTAPTCRTWP